MNQIAVTDGNGCWYVDDWRELWRLTWGALAFALRLEANGGACPGCGCRVAVCAYCLHECYLTCEGP